VRGSMLAGMGVLQLLLLHVAKPLCQVARGLVLRRQMGRLAVVSVVLVVRLRVVRRAGAARVTAGDPHRGARMLRRSRAGAGPRISSSSRRRSARLFGAGLGLCVLCGGCLLVLRGRVLLFLELLKVARS